MAALRSWAMIEDFPNINPLDGRCEGINTKNERCHKRAACAANGMIFCPIHRVQANLKTEAIGVRMRRRWEW